MVEEIVVKSKELCSQHRSLVFWPEGRSKVAQPVLYLFRGKPEEWFAKPKERQGRNLEIVVAHLNALGYMRPFVIVCPDTTLTVNGQDFFTCAFDLSEPPAFTNSGKFCRFFTEEYFPLIENELFGDMATKRAIGGFSLGSLAAFTIGFHRYDLFSALASYDGAFLFWNYDHPHGCGPDENDLRLDWFPHWFGVTPDLQSFLRQNPYSLLQTAAGKRLHGLTRMKFFMHSSAEDHVTANAWREEKMAHGLVEAGCSLGFDSVLLSPEAKHDWYWADEHLYRLLPPLSKILWQ